MFFFNGKTSRVFSVLSRLYCDHYRTKVFGHAIDKPSVKLL